MKYINNNKAKQMALPAAIAVVSLIELALVERKYAVFAGGFGASKVISTLLEILMFALVYLLCQALSMGGLHVVMGKLFRRRWNGILFPISSFIVLVSSMVGILVLKYEILSYFSDHVSLFFIKALAGGSLIDAILFSLKDILPIIGGTVVAAVAVFLLLRVVPSFDVPPAPAPYQISRCAKMAFAAAALGAPCALYWSSQTGETAHVLNKFIAPQAVRSAASVMTDFDGDGYGLFSMLPDPAPFDSTVYPMALDHPNNGIDEDGLCGDFKPGGMVPAGAVRQGTGPDPAPDTGAQGGSQPPKHVIIVVLESTRGEILEKEINGKPLAPNIRSIASSGFSTTAYSHAGFTVPSLKTLFTGEIEPDHQVPSLFTDLKNRGYRIGVISGQSEGFGDISEVTGMRTEADTFVDAEILKEKRAFAYAAKGSLLIDEAVLMQEFDKNYGSPEQWRQSNFIYLNFQSAHFPYHHDGMENLTEPEPLPRGGIRQKNADRVIKTYWNAVSWSDHWIGKLVEQLKTLGVYQDSLVLVTADHGESLFDDGFLGHGHFINEQQTRIPLVLNRANVSVSGVIGLSNYRELVTGLLKGQRSFSFGDPVFQYVGALETPSTIGLVDRSSRRVIVDFQAQTLQIGNQALVRLDRLDDHQRDVGCQVIHRWETYRWRKHTEQDRLPASRG